MDEELLQSIAWTSRDSLIPHGLQSDERTVTQHQQRRHRSLREKLFSHGNDMIYPREFMHLGATQSCSSVVHHRSVPSSQSVSDIRSQKGKVENAKATSPSATQHHSTSTHQHQPDHRSIIYSVSQQSHVQSANSMAVNSEDRETSKEQNTQEMLAHASTFSKLPDRRNTASRSIIFGAAPEDALKSAKMTCFLPLFFEKAISYLLTYPQTPHILHMTMDPETQDAWKLRVEKYCVTIDFHDAADPYVVFDLLKIYLKDLPGFLIPTKDQSVLFAHTHGLPEFPPANHDYGVFSTSLADLLQRWSPERREMLLSLLYYFSELHNYVLDNNASNHEIARVFGPILFENPCHIPRYATTKENGLSQQEIDKLVSFRRSCRQTLISMIYSYPLLTNLLSFVPNVAPKQVYSYDDFRKGSALSSTV
eukprot:TRINITY_DN10536_c0_g1_i2.p1 TRINITY_DN10536_c0_g1~~TRINITY_DN10536_c0_g1_i2.p1  ORF type:complete len:422 (-),score=71.14 TRINITY_DN10536_c0_g1_i2:156-1421(-)